MKRSQEPSASTAPFAKGMLLCLTILCVAFSEARPAHATEAFTALQGSWSGAGSASFASGEREKLRCTASYGGGGQSLSIQLRCASASAQINLTGHLEANGRRVTGEWSESNFGISGNAHGQTLDGSIRLSVDGGASGFLTLQVAGDRHTIALSMQGTSLTGVNVGLSHR